MPLHVLAFAGALPSHVSSAIELIAELVARRNRVTCVTTDRFAPAVRDAGADVLSCAPDRPSVVDAGRHDGTLGPLVSIDATTIAGVRAASAHFAGERPDLILYDSAVSPGARVLSHAWQVPAVEMLCALASNDTFSLSESVRAKAAARTPSSGRGDTAPTGPSAAMSAFLAEFDIPVAESTEFLTRPEAMSLVFVPREFLGAGKTFDSRHVFVGPCLGRRRDEAEFRLDGFDPVVMLAGSTDDDDQLEFLIACTRAFSGMPWQVVVCAGPSLAVDLTTLADNVRVERHVTRLEVLRTADVLVTSVDISATMEALALGVPILAVARTPMQQVVADRIVELGLGRAANPTVGIDSLRRNVHDLIYGDDHRRAGDLMRRAIIAAEGASAAVDEIELFTLARSMRAA